MSYHLIASELINQLLYINFPSLELKIFLRDLKSMLSSSVALSFRNLGNIAKGRNIFLMYRQLDGLGHFFIKRVSWECHTISCYGYNW